MKVVIAIDIDGTVTRYEVEKPIEFIPEAIKVINEWYNKGYTIILCTGRIHFGDASLQEILKAMEFVGLKYTSIMGDIPKMYNGVLTKVIIDNRAIGFKQDWIWIKQETEKLLESYK